MFCLIPKFFKAEGIKFKIELRPGHEGFENSLRAAKPACASIIKYLTID